MRIVHRHLGIALLTVSVYVAVGLLTVAAICSSIEDSVLRCVRDPIMLRGSLIWPIVLADEMASGFWLLLLAIAGLAVAARHVRHPHARKRVRESESDRQAARETD